MMYKVNFIEDKEKIIDEFAEIAKELKSRNNRVTYFTGDEDKEICSVGMIKIGDKAFRLIVENNDEMYLCSRENKLCGGFTNYKEVAYFIKKNQESYKVKDNGKFEGEYRDIKWGEMDYKKVLINLMNKSLELQNMIRDYKID